MDDITLDDFPPDRLADIVHWRNDPAVNRYLDLQKGTYATTRYALSPLHTRLCISVRL